jgi:hypothetical protein
MHILTSALVGGEWSVSRSCCLTVSEIALCYTLDRRLGGPHSRSGRRGEKKVLDPNRALNFNPSVVQPVASRCTDCAILVPPFMWVDRGKSRKISVTITGVPTEFRTENLPNISLKGYRYANLVNCIPLTILFLLLLLVLYLS